MGTLFGSVDEKRRPILRIEQPDGRDGFAALVDTGFNGHFMVHEADLDQLGFTPRKGKSEVQIASGQLLEVQLAEANVIWFGNKSLRVGVLVVPEPPPRRAPDDPIVLLGNKLIDPHKLTIDFTLNTVEITSAD